MFTFADMIYKRLSDLCVFNISKCREYEVWRDIHGRKVVYYYERYPCFDSSDYLYEDRGYHYFYVKQKDDLACLYYDDGTRELKVYDSDHMPVKVFRTILQKELQSTYMDNLIGMLQISLHLRKHKEQ